MNIMPFSKAKQTKSVLQNVRVASPCPARWDQMVGNNRVRHCAECNLNVYNLSAMTSAEAEKLLAQREGRLCVRYYRRHDGTILTQDCPRGLRAAARRLTRIASATLSALISVSFVAAQTTTKPEQEKVNIAMDESGFILTAVDITGAVIPNAEVRLKRKGGNKEIVGRTDASGIVKLHGLQGGQYIVKVGVFGLKPHQEQLALPNHQTTSMTISLGPRAVKTVIEVTADAPRVEVGALTEIAPVHNPDDGTLKTTFDSHAIENIP